MTRTIRIVLSAALCFLLTPSLFAQLSTATMFGTATDSTGAAIPGAKITLTQTQTNFTREVVTDSSGSYRAEFLPVGPYTVMVTAPGFKAFTQKGIILAAQQEAEVKFPLATGDVGTTIEVTSDVPLVNLGNSTLGSTIDNHEVDNLPIVDRNAYTLLTLTPGVQNVTNENSIGMPMEHVIINGASDNMVGQVTYYLDGGLNMTGVRNTGNVLPNPDAIDQFNVQTSNFSAQYGRTGAGVVSALTKSGTNQVHGSVFYFNRETNFNSNSYGQTTRTPFHRNYFGATAGGPIKKDKIFFFGSWGGLREIDPFNYNTVVPDADQRIGNFAENLPTTTPLAGIGSGKGCNTTLNAADKANTDHGGKFFVCDPVTHLPVPGNDLRNMTGGLHIDPTSAAVLNTNPAAGQIYVPLSTRVDNRLIGNFGLPNNTNEWLAKFEFQLVPNHRVTADYFQSNGALVQMPANWNLQNWAHSNYSYRQQNGNLSDVWTVSPRSVNQVWLNYTRMISARISTPQTTFADPIFGGGSELNVQGPPSLPDISVAGFFHLANAISGPKTGSNVYGLRDVYSSTLGKHTFNAGGELYLEKDVQYTNENNYGVFTYSNNTLSSSSQLTSAAIADFLLGRPTQASQDAPDFSNERYWNWALFLQDDWRLLPNFTVNLGVRYDVQTAPIDNQRRVAVLRKGVQSTVAPTAILGQLFPGDPGVPDGGTATNYNHVSPRVGFTFDPFSNGHTVFHGGAGLFFDSIGGNEWALSQNFQPFSVRLTSQFKSISSVQHMYSTDPTDFAGGVSPFPYNYDPVNPRYISPAQLVFVQDGMRWPYNIQVNFGMQQQLSKDFAFGLSYVGAFSRKIPLYVDNNAPLLNTTTPSSNLSTNADCRRPYLARPFATGSTTVCAPLTPGAKYISSANVITDNQTTNYHGLQVTVQKRLSHHISVSAFYIFSKSMASGSLQTTGNLGNSAATQPEDYYHMNLEKQLSDNDQRNQANITVVWKPDYFSGFNPVVRYALNGWTISAITNLRSGKPFNITSGSDDNFDGDNNDRPNLVPGQIAGHIPYSRINPNLTTNQPKFFNTIAYCKAGSGGVCPAGLYTLGLDGAVRPNSMIGPGFKQIDLAIFRDFGIHERVKFQIRGEATNIANWANLGQPGGTMGTAAFGQITGLASGANMRQIQVGARLLF